MVAIIAINRGSHAQEKGSNTVRFQNRTSLCPKAPKSTVVPMFLTTSIERLSLHPVYLVIDALQNKFLDISLLSLTRFERLGGAEKLAQCFALGTGSSKN